ncbi:DegT/DnrJ/EryC1/StrS family aminotransferase [Altererythrobacter aquiaggeris]|uniref:DegT/DnrJ/EryC1/StrS family aminotransferase n=1 Tax=Aestuarierythrobacter aquiaggeris TaxID=1898396 RepID=UPI003017AE0F
MPVPFFKPSIGDEEIAAVVECLKSGWLTTGPKTGEFEEQFAETIGGGVHALAVNSATAALHLGVDALGIGPGDEVIVPTLTFTATAEVVRYVGGIPVFVDCDPATLCIDPKAAEAAITERTRLIMPVHFAGRMCDMTALREIADRHGLKILDDAAHALPASHQGQSVGLTGADVTAFSFYANKTMTTGEGGMLVTRDAELAGRARIMRLHGIDRDVFNRFSDPRASWMYDVVAPGYKYNLTDIASAMGSVQLSRHQDFALRRTELAARYDTAFADLPLILPPHPAPGDTHSWHLYIVQVASDSKVNRDELIAALRERGIGTSVHYRPLHQMQFWSSYCEGRSFPAADTYFDRCVSLPLFMAMTNKEQDEVIQTVRSVTCNG